MSRSNNVEIKNPSTRFFEWAGDGENGNGGYFTYFDKEKVDDLNPKGTKIKVPLPFTFVVLDVLSTITGWNDADGCGIYANEVKDLKTQILDVRTFKKTDIAKGVYEAIKDKCISNGGSFTSSVYIGYYEGKELKIGHIKIRGAALGAWIDYGKKNSFYKGAITVKSFTEGKKGKTLFRVPVFTQSPISDATDETAKYLDSELQDYLNKYFAKNNQSNIERESVKAAEEVSQDRPGIENYSQETPPLTTNDAPPEYYFRNEDVPESMKATDDLPF